MRFEKTDFLISCWELIFAIFWKSRSNGTYNFFVFLSKDPLKGIQIQIKQHGNVTLLHYNGLKITRVPLDVLSAELSVAFSPSNQYFCI